MAETIDGLVIEIEGESTSATDALAKLEETLGRLKTIAKGGITGLNTASRQLKRFNEAINNLDLKSTKKLDKLSKSFSNISFKSGKLTNAVKKNTSSWLKNALSIGAVIRVGSKIADLIELSNNYTENRNLFNVALGKYADEAKSYAAEVRDVMGVDPSEWMRNQGIFMTLATGFGVASERAYLMSKNLTQLGYDISSFYNTSVEDAMQKLQSGISGELEPLRRLGYDLSQAKLEATAFALGIEESVSAMTQAEKAQLRYYAIMTQVTEVQGDMSRTLESPANQLRIFSSSVTQAGRAIGNIFIPALNKALPYLIASLHVIEDIADEIARLLGFTLSDIEWDKELSFGEQMEEDIEGANGAAKKLKNFLMGFDELNVISADDGSGNGDDNGIDDFDFKLPEYDFLGDAVNTKVSEIEEKIKSNLDKIMLALDPLAFAVGAALTFTGANIPFGLGIMAATAADFGYRVATGTFDTLLSDIEANGALIKNAVAAIPLAVGAILAFSGASIPLGLGLMAVGAVSLGASAIEKWGGLGKKMNGAISTIENTLLTAGVVIGGVLTFSGANIPLGLGLMIGSGALLGTKLAVNWNSITSSTEKVISELGGILGGASLVLGAVLTFTGANLPIGIGMMALGAASIATAVAVNWNSIKDILTNVCAGALSVLSLAGGVIGFLFLLNPTTFGLGLGMLFAAYKGTQTAYSMSVNPVTQWVTGIVNSVINVINDVIDKINNILGTSFDTIEFVVNSHISAAGVEHGGRGGSFGYAYTDDRPEYRGVLRHYARGGFPDEGELFVAREAGAEMVGSVGGKTAVANNDQIVEAVSAGVYQAVLSAMKQSGGENTPSLNVYLDGRQIASSVKRANKERGASILGNEVYSY